MVCMVEVRKPQRLSSNIPSDDLISITLIKRRRIMDKTERKKWYFIVNGSLITVRASTQFRAFKRARILVSG